MVASYSACGYDRPEAISAEVPHVASRNHRLTLHGMEWKEHVGWLVPITITVPTVVVMRYGDKLRRHPKLQSAVLGAVLFSFASSAIAGFRGAMIDKSAPVEGGQTIRVIRGAAQKVCGRARINANAKAGRMDRVLQQF